MQDQAVSVPTSVMKNKIKVSKLLWHKKSKNLVLTNTAFVSYNPPQIQWKADIAVRYLVLLNSSINFIIYCMVGSRYNGCTAPWLFSPQDCWLYIHICSSWSTYRWNGHFEDSILGQHLSLHRKFSALNDSRAKELCTYISSLVHYRRI